MTPSHRSLRALVGIGAGWVSLRAFLLLSPADVAVHSTSNAKIAAAARDTVQPTETMLDVVLDASDLLTVRHDALTTTRKFGQFGLLRSAIVKPPQINLWKSIPQQNAFLVPAPIVNPQIESSRADSAPTLPLSARTDTIRPSNAPPQRKALTLSSWLLIRPDGQENQLASSGQLAASQIGARLAYPILSLTGRESVVASSRVSSSLSTPVDSEASVGIGIRHNGRIAAELLVEQRFKLSGGGQNAVAVVAAAGIYDIKLRRNLRAEAYIQTGIVNIARPLTFIDGAARVEHEIESPGQAKFAGGGGLWAAAQPGISRLDIGPQLTVRPRIGSGNARISAEWRIRIAGNARPTSGPGLSAGFDF